MSAKKKTKDKQKRALITGVTGQDGAYLAAFLLKQGYKVFGTFRRISTPNFWRLQYLNIFEKIHLIPIDLIDSASLTEAIKFSNPDELYHLAAQSFVGASFEQPVATGEVSGMGVTRILEAVRNVNPKIKFYQASTSELFGKNRKGVLNENSGFNPSSPYAAAKLYAYWITKMYREGYGLYTVNGILFNHESPLRGLEFITRKISNGVAKIALGLEKTLSVGNIKSRRDWGYAPEYVETMWLMLQQKEPDDYVIATNETHSVEELLSVSFSVLNLDYTKYIKIDKRFFRPLEVNFLKGDSSKATKHFKWKSKVHFKELIEIMVKKDFNRWERCLKGEHFPWDAYNYPNDNRIISRMLKLER